MRCGKRILQPSQTKGNPNDHNEDLQTAQQHTAHLYDQGCIIGHRAGDPNGKANGIQCGRKVKYGLHQRAVCRHGHNQRADHIDHKIGHDKVSGRLVIKVVLLRKILIDTFTCVRMEKMMASYKLTNILKDRNMT